MRGSTHFFLIKFSFLLLIFSTSLNATEHFQLIINKKSIQLGKPIWATLKTNQPQPDLSNIDFTKLDMQFEVIRDKNSLRQTTQGQSWLIRLYPRQQGSQTIPALQFGSDKSTPVQIQVNQPIDNKTKQPFNISYQLSTTTPWTRQQVLATYQVNSPEAKLVLAPQQTDPAHSLLIPLETNTQQQANGFKHTSGWAIFPRQPGKQSFKLPALNFIRDGVVTHKFYPPRIKLDVKPLPTYLPGNIPVGQLAIQHAEHNPFVLKNNINNLSLTLIGKGIPKTWLPDIRGLFNSQQDITIYPTKTRATHTKTGQLISQHQYDLPYKITGIGKTQLTTNKLHYFDPQTGKLQQLHLPTVTFFALSNGLLVILSLCLFVLLVYLWRIIMAWLMPHWRCFWAYYAALKTLPQLKTAEEFKQIIGMLSEGEGRSSNVTLRQWQANTVDHAKNIIQQLEVALYRGEVCDVDSIRKGVREVCLSRCGVLRWVDMS